MRRYGWMLALLVAVSGAGCSREEAGKTPEEQSSESMRGSRLPDDNVFSDQVKTLEKAEDVQRTLDAAAANEREAIEQQR